MRLAALAASALALRCAQPHAPAPPPAGPPRWMCPAEWVPYEQGGCGPAVVLCAPDGAAAPGACAGVDLSARREVPDDDGATRGVAFYRGDDGAIRGGWPAETGAPGGPPDPALDGDVAAGGVPALDWTPDAAGLQSCPPAWRDASGACTAALRTNCPVRAEPLPDRGCTATDDARACPAAGEFPAPPTGVAPDTPVLRVRADAPPDPPPDGSVDHPYATVAAALAAAPAGREAFLLLAAGAYDGPVRAASGASVHVWGLCPGRVTLSAPASVPDGVDAVLAADNAALDVRGLTVQGAGRLAGITALAGATVTVSAVRVEHAAGRGLAARGARAALTARDAAVVATAARTASDTDAAGLAAEDGGALEATGVYVGDAPAARGVAASSSGTTGAALRLANVAVRANGGVGLDLAGAGATAHGDHLVLASNAGRGVRVLGGASATLDYVAASGTRANPAIDALGPGVLVGGTGDATVTHALLLDNVAYGAVASGSRASLTLADATVRSTRPLAGGAAAALGRGLSAELGATVHAARVLIEASTEAGAFAGGGARLELIDAVVRDTRWNPTLGDTGYGLFVGSRGQLDATRVVVRGNHDIGVLAGDRATALTLTSCVVRDTQPRAAGDAGRGLVVQGGAHATVRGTRVESNREAGVHAVSRDTLLELSDSVLRATDAGPDGLFGYGLVVSLAAHVTATRVTVEDNHEDGVRASRADTLLVLSDSVVRRTQPHTVGPALGGHGLVVFDHAQANVARTWFADNAEVGVLATDQGALRLRDVAVTGTTAHADDGLAGRGLVAQTGATLDAARVLVGGSHEDGLAVLSPASAATLRDVLIDGVAPSAAGLGVGLLAVGGAQIDAARVAVRDVAGAGIASAAALLDGSGVDTTGARLSAQDVWVRGVADQTVDLDDGAHPRGRAVAYGAHAAAGCTLDATRAVLDDGGDGFHAAPAASLALHTAVVSRQRVAGGVVAPGAFRSDALTLWMDTTGVQPDNGLPDTATLSVPPPLTGCTDGDLCN